MGQVSIWTSVDGKVWQARTNPWDSLVFATGRCVAAGSGLLVAGADVFASDGPVLQSSTDGITWTPHASAADLVSPREVAFGSGLWVLGMQKNGAGHIVMTSPDGATWTQQTTPVDGSGGQQGNTVCWDGTNFVLGVKVGGGGGAALTSPDGVTWSTHTSTAKSFTSASRTSAPDAVTIGGISPFPFIGIVDILGGLDLSSRDAQHYSLDNGVVWASPEFGFQALDAVWDGGQFVATDGGSIWTNPNGTGSGGGWVNNPHSTGLGDLNSVTYSPTHGLYVAAGTAASHSPGPFFASSTDLTTWTLRPTSFDGDSSCVVNMVRWDSLLGLFVAVGNAPFTITPGSWILG